MKIIRNTDDQSFSGDYREKFSLYYLNDEGQPRFLVNDRKPSDLEMEYSAAISPAMEGKDVSMTIPQEKDGYPVSMAYIFYDYEFLLFPAEHPPKLKYLYIPSTVRDIRIDNVEFCNCTVEISPDNPYLCVYENAIYSKDMTELRYIMSPVECFEPLKSVKRICSGAGRRLQGLRRLVIPESVKIIEGDAFAHCPDLTEADIRAREIGSGALFWCKALASLKITGCKKMGRIAFSACEALRSVELTNTEEIGESAFFSTSSLTEIQLPETMRRIGEGAFFNSGVKQLTIPAGVHTLGENILDTSGLKEFRLTIYLDDGHLRFEGDDPVPDNTIVTVLSAETNELLFEFVKFGGFGKIFTMHGVDFTEYDLMFRSKKGENAYYKALAAWYRLLYPIGMNDEKREMIKSYASRHSESALRGMISGDTSSADKIAESPFLKLIDDERLARLIDKSTKHKKPELTALLMQELHERKTK